MGAYAGGNSFLADAEVDRGFHFVKMVERFDALFGPPDAEHAGIEINERAVVKAHLYRAFSEERAPVGINASGSLNKMSMPITLFLFTGWYV